MTFYRLTAPLNVAPPVAKTGKPEDARETLFARMIRLWVEHNERVVQYRMLDH